MDNKPQVFVRYPLGASGYFLSTLILALTTKVQLVNSKLGHSNGYILYKNNNFIEQYHDTQFNYYSFNDRPDSEITHKALTDATAYFTNKFKFKKTKYPIHVIPTHARCPSGILQAFNNTFLINVDVTAADLEQIAYNWVTKSLLKYDERWDVIDSHIKYIQLTHPTKLQDVTVDTIDRTDVKFLTYLARFGFDESQLIAYKQTSITSSAHSINFADIVNKNIINQLDEIADHIGVTITNENRENAISIINQYADAQDKINWKFSLDDY
jgi:hypothetical protein